MFAIRTLGVSSILLLACLALDGCQEPADPCDAFERFSEALEPRCGSFAWDCEAVYPTLGPETQQDLDWCLDCIRAQEEGDVQRSCEAAPLSGESCPTMLSRTLDASCLDVP